MKVWALYYQNKLNDIVFTKKDADFFKRIIEWRVVPATLTINKNRKGKVQK